MIIYHSIYQLPNTFKYPLYVEIQTNKWPFSCDNNDLEEPIPV